MSFDEPAFDRTRLNVHDRLEVLDVYALLPGVAARHTAPCRGRARARCSKGEAERPVPSSAHPASRDPQNLANSDLVRIGDLVEPLNRPPVDPEALAYFA